MATASLPVESEEMDCSVCREHFQEPKFLTCGHLVCRQCLLPWLQAHTQGQCPLCRYPIINEHDRRSRKSLADIADSFLTDRAMAALVEAHRLLSEQHVCCVCVNVAAVSMCMDCRNMFCQHCSNVHKKQSATKHHTVEQLRSLTEEKLAANSRRACAVHSDKLPEVFCPSHGASVCLRCATTVHRQCPDVKDLEERVREARDTLHELTVILTARETEVGRDITRLDQQLTDIDQQKQAAIDELTATFDDIEAAEKASRRRLNDMIVQTSSEEKRSVNDVKNSRLDQRGKLTLHKRLVARSESIISSDDVTNMTPEIERLVKDLGCSISSQANAHVTSRIELAIDLAEVTRIKRALLDLGKGTGSSFDDGTTARINHLEQNVHQLQRDLTSTQSERASLVQQVRTLQQELAGERRRVQVVEQEVKRKDDQIKWNEAEIASCKDEIRSKVKEMKQQKHMYDQLQTELQGEMARHQNTTKQLRDSKKTCSALGNDIASYQRKLREFSGKAPVRKTSVTQPSKSTHQQTKAFRFHDNHGKKVVLSNDQKTAEFRGDFGDGGGYVMSRDPMEVNKLNEVQLTKIYKGMAICVGVVTSSPDSLTLPDVAGGWKNAVTVYHDGFFDHGDWSPPICVRCQTETYIAQALCGLPANSRVGVSVDRHNRRLHVHVNGDDQ
ncbi:tripartite motif-containing protein 3-like [Littorina saxatilis]|uniref:tripartite motif-containing protein 3-like n=1 Tax=Littorina saxatilis TaxID=31220 RepID=UPI0038B5C769